MGTPHLRQRPRSASHETTGTLSYQAIGSLHARHADPGETIDRRSGTRAATTFRNDPTARPGRNAMPAAARPMRRLSARRRAFLTAVAARWVRLGVDVRVAGRAF